jgi:hypothetical protein
MRTKNLLSYMTTGEKSANVDKRGNISFSAPGSSSVAHVFIPPSYHTYCVVYSIVGSCSRTLGILSRSVYTTAWQQQTSFFNFACMIEYKKQL